MFLTVKFQPGDARTYTYRYHGAAHVEPDDYCVVETRDGNKPVQVVDVDVEAPPFACKAVVAILTERV